jgi:hypothetical protein
MSIDLQNLELNLRARPESHERDAVLANLTSGYYAAHPEDLEKDLAHLDAVEEGRRKADQV